MLQSRSVTTGKHLGSRVATRQTGAPADIKLSPVRLRLSDVPSSVLYADIIRALKGPDFNPARIRVLRLLTPSLDALSQFLVIIPGYIVDGKTPTTRSEEAQKILHQRRLGGSQIRCFVDRKWRPSYDPQSDPELASRKVVGTYFGRTVRLSGIPRAVGAHQVNKMIKNMGHTPLTIDEGKDAGPGLPITLPGASTRYQAFAVRLGSVSEAHQLVRRLHKTKKTWWGGRIKHELDAKVIW